METELCNMCMITDPEGRVLVQERLSKPSNAWSFSEHEDLINALAKF